MPVKGAVNTGAVHNQSDPINLQSH